VKEGLLHATIEYPNGVEEAVQTALKILKKEKVPRNITLGTRIYMKDGVRKVN
jgi:hypothetical protein